MARAAGLRMCPDCKGELPFPIPQWCPHCTTDTAYKKEVAYDRNVKHLAHRWAVATVSERVAEEKIALEKKPKDEEETRGFPLAIKNIEEEARDFYKNLPVKTKVGILTDARNVLSLILHSDMDGVEMKAIIELGKKIGEIAKIADDYVKTCGVP